MAVRTNIPVTALNKFDGADLPFQALDVANGMQVVNTGKVVVYVRAAASGNVTVAIPSRADLNNRTGDVSKVVSGNDAAKVTCFGPFGDSSIWGDGVNVFLDFSAKTGTVDIAAAQV